MGESDDEAPVEYRVRLRHPGEDLGFDFECETWPGEPGTMHLVRIAPGGPCDRAGVQPGILVTLNGVEVYSVDDLKEAVMGLRRAQVTQFIIAVIPQSPDDPNAAEQRAPQVAALQPLPAGRPDPRQRRGRGGGGERRHQPRQYNPPPAFGGGQHGGGAAPGHAAAAAAGGGAAGYAEGEPLNREELLATRLRGLAVLRQRGMIDEPTYRRSKRQILRLLADDDEIAHLNDTAGSGRGQVVAPVIDPPSPWARVTVSRYVYLRTAPYRGAPFVDGPGVTGVVNVSHMQGAFALARTAEGQRGYIRCKYLQFLSHHHRDFPQRSRQRQAPQPVAHSALAEVAAAAGGSPHPAPQPSSWWSPAPPPPQQQHQQQPVFYNPGVPHAAPPAPAQPLQWPGPGYPDPYRGQLHPYAAQQPIGPPGRYSPPPEPPPLHAPGTGDVLDPLGAAVVDASCGGYSPRPMQNPPSRGGSSWGRSRPPSPLPGPNYGDPQEAQAAWHTAAPSQPPPPQQSQFGGSYADGVPRYAPPQPSEAPCAYQPSAVYPSAVDTVHLSPQRQQQQAFAQAHYSGGSGLGQPVMTPPSPSAPAWMTT
eukprot:TRINITY_DN7932_c1_g1_i1.p1 TRINITY_DN7932_c1_g1~~TRINITY_DN7932_c1_g1_i1.p1  ORF type:complete len:612 (+),score=120.17 TRINITY_DN7932_c1_g1_i1:75-1838(+)